MKRISLALIIPIIAFAFGYNSANAESFTIEAGPIWGNNDANSKCPNICKGQNGQWSGHWWTTVQGQMSVCQCEKSVTVQWVKASGGFVPSNAFKGGMEHPPGKQILYICRAPFNGGTHPGKIRAGFGGCNIGWGGREHVVNNYEVLVKK